MADDTLTQYSRLAPYIEERGKQLLSATFGDPNAVQQTGESNEDFQARKLGRAGVAQMSPAFQVAGLTPQQQQAMAMSSQGIGQYQPFLNQASGTIGQGISSIAGSQGMFAPTAEGIQSYMDPYQQNVTQNALAELDRQGILQQQGMNAQQIGAGAFGTERGLSQLGQTLYGADVANLLQSGALGQTQGQNVLDAQRQTQLLQNQEPFQRLSFASGILTGTPASQMSVQQQPSTNPLMQIAGLGIMGLGAYKGLNVPNLV